MTKEMKIKLYIDIDGVLLGHISKNNPQIVIAQHIDLFLQFCLDNFDCYWLTTHCKDGDEKNALKYLSNYADEETLRSLSKIKPTHWNTLKTEAIDLTSDFIWIDDAPLDFEKELLKEHDHLDRWLSINTRRSPDDLARAVRLLEGYIRQ